MRVKIEHDKTGESWLLAEEGDPLRVDDYLTIARQWGVTVDRGNSWGGFDGGFVGEFRVETGGDVAEFVITFAADDA